MAGRGKLIALLAVMVIVPLGALSVLGVRLVEDQTRLVARQADELHQARLETLAAEIDGRLAQRHRELLDLLAGLPAEPDAVRSHVAAWRGVGRVLVLRRDGTVLFPPLDRPTSEGERSFLERTRPVWEDGVLTGLAAGAGSSEGGAAADAHGWYGWYHQDGLQLMAWRAEPERVTAVELPRVLYLAPLVDELPDTAVDAVGADTGRVALRDTRGRTVYQWGAYEPPADTPPRTTQALAAPLAAWTLATWAPPSAAAAGVESHLALPLGLGVLAVGLVLVVLAIVLYRERTREMRLASQRVSFVSQVSHELRTPLTNIRLYAELLAQDLEDLDDEAAAEQLRQVGVISAESERLTRLVDNVLSFARGQEGRLKLRRAPGVVDETIRRVAETLAPSLDARGVAAELDLDAPARVAIDSDAVAQVLANLLSNVAKYAASGGRVTITSRQDGTRSVVRVADEGPGVPADHRERVFQPFHRVSDRLTDGVAGAGIGLDIARRLARLHGGDLRLVASESGACFELELETPPVEG